MGPRRFGPGAQNIQQHGREHDVTILPTLTLLHSDHQALTVDRGGLHPRRLGDALARRVTKCRDHAVLDHDDRAKNEAELLAAEYDRKRLGLVTGGITSSTFQSCLRVTL